MSIVPFDNGYLLGTQNKVIETSCPIEVRSWFEKGYAQGTRERKDKLDELQRESDDIEREEMINGSPQIKEKPADSIY